MTREEIENCWNDPHSWKWVGIYYCKADPRVIVPRRIKWMGWTINAAHPSTIPVLLGIIALAVVPAAIVAANGGGAVSVLLTIAASTLVICSLAAYLSSNKRWSR